MASIEVLKGPVFTRRFQVDAGAEGSIKPGTPLKAVGVYVAAVADGDPEVATDQFVGIASSISTETATVDGWVEVKVVIPGQTVLRGKANTPSNLSNNYRGNHVTFDVSGSVFTIDENEASDPDVHGLVIVDQDATRGTVDFMVQSEAMIIGSSIAA
jgi:hypothetical protein